MAQLHHTRCLHHALREAVARCPECRNFFCRECITEHDGRVMCAACIQKSDIPDKKDKSGFFKVGLGRCIYTAKITLGVFFLWLFFYGLGQLLLMIPDSFHSGDMWGQV